MTPILPTRRLALALGLAALLGGCAQTTTAPVAPPAAAAPAAPPAPPIVFVHGNGDTAALWSTTLWRFESQGWPRDRLLAIDLPYPLARDADDQPQPGRTSSTEHMRFLAEAVDEVLRRTGATQVVLMGNSRGGNAIRNFIANGGGATKVSHAILGGTPNHGVWSNPGFRPTNEFNGAGPFLKALNNQGAPGVEITPGPRWMTVRSDNNDKFAQPDGVWIGAKGTPTNVGFDGPELRGATNVVLAGIDHRETSYGEEAFVEAYRFITGRAPTRPLIVPETRVSLQGKVSGLGLGNDPSKGSFATNLPLAGATVEVHAVDVQTGERRGTPLWRGTTAADGRWGPAITDARTPLEFVVSAPGYATAHIYRSPFPRSSDIVHLRAERAVDVTTGPDQGAGALVTLVRPRGYIGIPRDPVVFDGQSPPPGIPPGVAGVASSKIKLPPGPPRAVVASFRDERLVGRSWPAAQGHTVILELHP